MLLLRLTKWTYTPIFAIMVLKDKRNVPIRRVYREADIQNIAVSCGADSHHICSGVPVLLHLLYDAAVYCGLCDLCDCHGHDDISSGRAEWPESLGAGMAHIPIWNTPVRILAGGKSGRFE